MLPDDWQPYEPPEVVPEGQRNETLARLAGWLMQSGMGLDDAEAMMRDYNAVACRPPLPVAEVERIARSVSRYHR